jgi:hypothetical protein
MSLQMMVSAAALCGLDAVAVPLLTAMALTGMAIAAATTSNLRIM